MALCVSTKKFMVLYSFGQRELKLYRGEPWFALELLGTSELNLISYH